MTLVGMRTLLVGVTGTCLLGAVGTAWAHGLGGHYALSVPLRIYLAGVAALVALAFVVVGALGRGAPGWHTYPRVNLLRLCVGRVLAHPAPLCSLQLLSTALFVLIVLAGLLGPQNPANNLAPTFVWSIGWVGLAYVSAIAGNVWALVNPWKVLFVWAEGLYRRVAPGRQLCRHWPYPQALGAWPGVLLLLAFAWIELALQGAAVPANLAGMMLVYSALTWSGMFLFGTHVWLRYGEVFSMVFGLLAVGATPVLDSISACRVPGSSRSRCSRAADAAGLLRPCGRRVTDTSLLPGRLEMGGHLWYALMASAQTTKSFAQEYRFYACQHTCKPH